MKGELKLYAIAVVGILAMMFTYQGSAEEQLAQRTSVEAKEVSCQSETSITAYPTAGVSVAELVYQEPELVSLGTFKVTAYCSCGECCGKWADCREDGIVRGASGQELVAGYSIAVDPDVIPYGNEIYVNGQKYAAHDCGGSVKGNCIDLYMSSHKEAQEWGVQYIEVFKEVDK